MPYSLSEHGFEILPSVLTQAEIDALRSALGRTKASPGRRNLAREVSDVATLATSRKILGLLRERGRMAPIPVRSIFFDKTPESNWLVPWHQDLSIAVKERIDYPGYGPWSMKDGVPHVQPPAEILEAMVTIRLHLDDCDESNGALRVIPGSHRLGRLNAAHIAELRLQEKEVACSVRTGDALLMHPLLLHASTEALAPAHRRVIHLEYAACSLPDGLVWAETSALHVLKTTAQPDAQNI